MNKSIKTLFALLVLLMSSTGVWAQGKTAYAMLSSNNDGDGTKTLTFMYENHTVSGSTEWDVSDTGDGYPNWNKYNANKITRVVFEPSFADARPKSCVCWFSTCVNLATIEGIEYLNTSEVTDMRAMFSSCSKLTSLDVSHFNTGKVQDMAGMFSGCSGLTSLQTTA